jgi:hypothetical protein
VSSELTHSFLVSDRPPHFTGPARCSQGPPRGMRLSALSVNPFSFPFHRCAINLKLSPHLLDAAKKQVCSFITGSAICFLPFASGELGALTGTRLGCAGEGEAVVPADGSEG